MMPQDEILSSAWRRSAARSRLLLTGVMIATALVTCIAQWADFAALRKISPGFVGTFLRSDHPSWTAWSAQWFASAATLMAMAKVMSMLRSMAKGDPFARTVTTDLRSFALWILLATVASVLVPLVVAPILRWLQLASSGAQGQITGSDLLLLLVTAILYQIARLLDAARAIADDHRQIV